MLTRLTVGRVEPFELAISVAILLATILVIAVIAVRVYSAGVLLYGQRPGVRAYVRAARKADGPSDSVLPRSPTRRRGAAAGGSARRRGAAAVGASGHRRARGPAPAARAVGLDGDEPPQPRRRAGQVGARPLAGEDSGDPLGRGRLVERPALGRDRGHGDDLVAGMEDAAQQVASLVERHGQERSAVEVEQVEGEIGDRPARARRRAVARAPPDRPARRRRPRPARRRGPPSGRRARTAIPASSGSAAATSRPSASTIRTSPVARPLRRADEGERAAPPQAGSNT